MSPGARDRASALVRFAVASLAIWAALALSTAAVAAQTVLTCSVSGSVRQMLSDGDARLSRRRW